MQTQERAQTETGFDMVHVQPEKRSAQLMKRRETARKESTKPMARSEDGSGRMMKTPELSKAVAPTRREAMRTDLNIPSAPTSPLRLSAPTAEVEKTPTGNQIGSGAGILGRGFGAGDRPGNGAGGGGGARILQIRSAVKEVGDLPPDNAGPKPPPAGYREGQNPILKIAYKMVKTYDENEMVDLVFIFDASGSMRDDIEAVSGHLEEMAKTLQAGRLKYLIGFVSFQTLDGSQKLEFMKLTANLEKMRRRLQALNVSGDEYAIDAVFSTMREMEFRGGSSRRFVLVTDEPSKLTRKRALLLEALKKEEIAVDVIGQGDMFQRSLATETGGIWIPIRKLHEF